jgi:hypothetical protein
MTEERGTGQRRPSTEGGRALHLSRRHLLVGGGAVAGVAAAWWYGSALVDFEGHIARVLGVSTELAQALIESARDTLGGNYELQAVQFLAATRFPGTELPEGLREEGVRSLLEAMFDRTNAKTAYADLISASDLGRPCPGLGPV